MILKSWNSEGKSLFNAEKVGLFLKKVPLLEYGSPSWTYFELLKVLQKKSEAILGNEKGHTLFGYGLEILAHQRGRSWVLGGRDIPLILLIRSFQLIL
jgi:hypothetical protein